MGFCCNIGGHKMHRKPPPPLLWKERPCLKHPITWEITSPWNHLSPAPSTLKPMAHSFPYQNWHSPLPRICTPDSTSHQQFDIVYQFLNSKWCSGVVWVALFCKVKNRSGPNILEQYILPKTQLSFKGRNLGFVIWQSCRVQVLVNLLFTLPQSILYYVSCVGFLLPHLFLFMLLCLGNPFLCPYSVGRLNCLGPCFWKLFWQLWLLRLMTKSALPGCFDCCHLAMPVCCCGLNIM